MSTRRFRISVVPGSFAVCRLEHGAPLPGWSRGGAFWSVTGTTDELSVVCEEPRVPAEVRAERGFALLKLAGPLEFSLVGVFASIATPLADAGISIVPIATFDTDYFMVRANDLARAAAVLREAGHEVG